MQDDQAIQQAALPPMDDLSTTTVVVTFPTGGTFPDGSMLTVTWNTTGPVSSHTVKLSLNDYRLKAGRFGRD
jgi:hypothetical protein